MPTAKPKFKKVYENIDSYEECTWLSNDKPIFENNFTAVFNDKYPSVEGHMLFVPKKNSADYIGESYKLAYSWGDEWIQEGKINGFNAGQNMGKCAGQTVMWPHIHFIPRHDGDSDLKKQLNGVRIAHPNGNNRHFY